MNTVGVMTILEGVLADEVRRLWRLFEEQYGSVGVQTFAHPNLTFSAGRCDDCNALDGGLAQVAQQLAPFELVVRGIDAFHQPARVIFLSIVQTDELMQAHQAIHTVVAAHCRETVPYYQPQAWVPHITLAMGDLTEEAFNQARVDLSAYPSGMRDMASTLNLIRIRNDVTCLEIVSSHRLMSR